MEELREGNALVVWRLDRFGRSLKDLVSKMESLEEKGVDFVSITEGIDTTTAQGKLTLHIFGGLAEFERELARERTMAGLKAAREPGRVGGRPPTLGEEEIPQVQAMMKDEEVSTLDIRERFGISRPTLYRYVGPEGQRCR
jgi:DNA invertase Pin-like site-specific DNA recombinase